jgi:hypothetical protein
VIVNCKIYSGKNGQFVVVFIDVKMFNVINNRPRFKKNIQHNFFSGLDIIVTHDFLSSTPFER